MSTCQTPRSYRELIRTREKAPFNQENEDGCDSKETRSAGPGCRPGGFHQANPLQKYPARFKQIVNGMSETSGLSMAKMESLDLNYCSAEAAWGPYTGGGPLVVGRNNDFPGVPAGADQFSNIVVYNPSDGSMPCAFFADVGAVSADTGYNCNGLMIESNDALEGSSPTQERMLFSLEMPQFMFDSANLGTLSTEVASTRPNMPQICLVCDKNMGISYELTSTDYRKAPPTADGLVIQTNDFVDPYWGGDPVQQRDLGPEVQEHGQPCQPEQGQDRRCDHEEDDEHPDERWGPVQARSDSCQTGVRPGDV